MEFSDLGSFCSICHQKDFLPFTCKFCKKEFCLKHRTIQDHQCEYKQPIQIKPIHIHKKKRNRCSVCRKKHTFSNAISTCEHCNKYICMLHRYRFEHDCIKLVKQKPIKQKPIKKKSFIKRFCPCF